jgi:hypothetical protein
MTYDGRNEKLAKETRGDMKWETKIFSFVLNLLSLLEIMR